MRKFLLSGVISRKSSGGRADIGKRRAETKRPRGNPTRVRYFNATENLGPGWCDCRPVIRPIHLSKSTGRRAPMARRCMGEVYALSGGSQGEKPRFIPRVCQQGLLLATSKHPRCLDAAPWPSLARPDTVVSDHLEDPRYGPGHILRSAFPEPRHVGPAQCISLWQTPDNANPQSGGSRRGAGNT